LTAYIFTVGDELVGGVVVVSARVALSIREKLQEPEGWWSSGLMAKEYRLRPPEVGMLVWCWKGCTRLK
jgi:hypothetical protein